MWPVPGRAEHAIPRQLAAARAHSKFPLCEPGMIHLSPLQHTTLELNTILTTFDINTIVTTITNTIVIDTVITCFYYYDHYCCYALLFLRLQYSCCSSRGRLRWQRAEHEVGLCGRPCFQDTYQKLVASREDKGTLYICRDYIGIKIGVYLANL